MTIKVFVGFDRRTPVAYHALCQSIIELSSSPVCFTPIVLSNLEQVFSRPVDPLQSTEFSFSRFLTPYLSRYEGWSLYLDSDMLFRRDIAELWALRDPRYAVMCCKHQHAPTEDRKFLGRVQSRYERKNWSSLLLFNNARCAALTPEIVRSAPGLHLHQLRWLEDERQIGELPMEWNHLVGVQSYDPAAANVHFTLGGPYLEEFAECEYAGEWFRCSERARLASDAPLRR